MKKRRTSIAAFLLLASLSLGVGYAALTDTLSVNGGAKGNVDNSNLEVVFEETVKEATLCSLVVANDKVTANMTVDALDTKGQKGVGKLTVVNNTKNAVEDELDATLSTPQVVETDAEDYFKVSAYWEDTSDLVLEAARTGVEAGTNVLVIEVELIKTPTDSANLPTATFTVTFTATTK